MAINTAIDQLPMTSPRTVKRLQSLAITTFEDLLNYFPSRYENYSLVSTIAKLQPGETVTIRGQITEVKNEYRRNKLTIQKIGLTDGTGNLEIVWYNQLYLTRILRPRLIISVAGAVKSFNHRLLMEAHQYEILTKLDQAAVHTGRIIPIYPEIRGLSSKTLREKIWRLLKTESIPEIFPPALTTRCRLTDEAEAYRNIHFPKNLKVAKLARHRLAFDEMSVIQLSSALVKRQWQKQQSAPALKIDKIGLNQLINRLPFALTGAQTRCVGQILADISRRTPMNRLLGGEVGSGKTVVAAVAAYVSWRNRYRTVLMAPTEILAAQHYQSLAKLFTAALPTAPQIVLYSSSNKPKKAELKTADIIIGTQALIEKTLSLTNVGLTVIDEQHKFGVLQRGELKKKAGASHLLTMTATPIPRTVVLTFFGELELSLIDEMPKERQLVKTYLVAPAKRPAAYDWIKKQIWERQIQVFVICPLIEVSEKETQATIKAAKKEFEDLRNQVFPEFKVGLLHGQMRAEEKDAVMEAFAQGRVDILVSTPVVEVGIDIPNAAVIVIEAAERFGLAQLHQLRGRVGRGRQQSYCLLFTSDNSRPNLHRLKTFAGCFNGFELAEYDLRLRGAGELYGTKQHGVPSLKIASLTDLTLAHQAREAMSDFLTHYQLDDYPLLQKRLEKYRISLINRD